MYIIETCLCKMTVCLLGQIETGGFCFIKSTIPTSFHIQFPDISNPINVPISTGLTFTVPYDLLNSHIHSQIPKHIFQFILNLTGVKAGGGIGIKR